MNKELLQQKAESSWEQINKFMSQQGGVNPYAFTLGFKAGAKEILDNPELYGLVKRDTYDTSVAFRNDLYAEYTTLEKENKELKEEIEKLKDEVKRLVFPFNLIHY